MAIPPVSAQVGSNRRAISKKRPASAALSDAENFSANTASTSTMRTNTSASDAHKKRKRRRRKLSVTKDVPILTRSMHKDDGSLAPSGSGSHKGKESADMPESNSIQDITVVSGSDTKNELALLREKVKQQTALLAAQKEFITALAPSLTCQICLEPMHRPYALAPCGHTACYGCLLAWFRAPPQHIAHPPLPHLAHNFDRDEPNLLARDTPMLLRKEKTCPHCRAVIRDVPVESWGIKDIVASLFAVHGNMAKDMYPEHVKPPEAHEQSAGQPSADAWKGVFRRDPRSSTILNAIADTHVNANGRGAAVANEGEDRGGDRGFFDDEDGVYRCTVCYHEIWEGICSSCARLYPGLLEHTDDGDDDGGNWMDAEGFDEEADWMDTHEHDIYEGRDEDIVDLHEIVGAFARGAGFLRGVNHDDDDDDEYESSFIDDDDGARIEEYHSAEDDGRYGGEDEEGGSEEGRPRRLSPLHDMHTADAASSARRPRRRINDTTINISDSDSVASEHVANNYRRGRGARILIDSDVEDADGDDDVQLAVHPPAPGVLRTSLPVRPAIPRYRPIIVDTDSENESAQGSPVSDIDEEDEFHSRSVSEGGSISGNESDHSSVHGEFYGSGSGSSRYNDAYSDEDNGINWSD